MFIFLSRIRCYFLIQFPYFDRYSFGCDKVHHDDNNLSHVLFSFLVYGESTMQCFDRNVLSGLF